jgi:cytochrome c551/c552
MKCLSMLLAAVAGLSTAGGALAGPGEDLITANKCNKCHTAVTTKKGPSFASVAKKYQNDAGAPAKLLKQLKEGGKVGDEDDHKKVEASDADIKAAVAVVLSSK